MGRLGLFWLVSMIYIGAIVPTVIAYPSKEDALSIPKNYVANAIWRRLNRLPVHHLLLKYRLR